MNGRINNSLWHARIRSSHTDLNSLRWCLRNNGRLILKSCSCNNEKACAIASSFDFGPDTRHESLGFNDVANVGGGTDHGTQSTCQNTSNQTSCDFDCSVRLNFNTSCSIHISCDNNTNLGFKVDMNSNLFGFQEVRRLGTDTPARRDQEPTQSCDDSHLVQWGRIPTDLNKIVHVIGHCTSL